MRGLKHDNTTIVDDNTGSHLLQMRGLKPLSAFKDKEVSVASFTDAWIETETWSRTANLDAVASFTDAWIETLNNSRVFIQLPSHLLQMRGLKRCVISRVASTALSHLLQMRGLKLCIVNQ